MQPSLSAVKYLVGLSRKLLIVLVWAFSSTQLMAKNNNVNLARDYCQTVLAGIDHRQLWGSLGEAAGENRCHKSWVSGQRGEFFACGDPAVSAPTASEFKSLAGASSNKWASKTQGWITTGVDHKGSNGQFSKRQISMGTALSFNDQNVVFFAEDPAYNDATSVVACAIDRVGNISLKAADGWDGNPKTRPLGNWLFELELSQLDKTDLLAIIVDFPDETSPGSSQDRFSVSLWNEYTRADLDVRGVADLHVHQTAELAFGGKLLWGGHAGPESTSLSSEQFTGTLTETDVDRITGQSLTGNHLQNGTEQTIALANVLKELLKNSRSGVVDMDANLIMRLAKSGFNDEGTASVGERGWPTFADWPHHADRSHQQVHSNWLRAANTQRADTKQNLALMVSSIVNNDILCNLLGLVDQRGNVPTTGNIGSESANYGCSDFENLNRQISALHNLERSQRWFRIALSPWHSREIVHAGDLAVVISMESDKPLSDANASIQRTGGSLLGGVGFYEADNGYSTDFIETLNDYHKRGVRSLQPVHESDSIFCGAAVHRSDMDLLQAVHWPGQVNTMLSRQGTAFDIEQDSYRNRIGLTNFGRTLIAEMVRLKMPIDLAHASNQCQLDIMSVVPSNYSLYNSHTKFDSLLRPSSAQAFYGSHVVARERGFLLTPDMEQVYADRRVMVGLRTASVDVYDAATDTTDPLDYAVPNDCPGSALSFGQMVKHADSLGLDFAYGTDFNTGVSQLGPRFGGGACYAASDTLTFTHRSTRPHNPGNWGDLSSQADRTTRIAGRNYYRNGLAHIGMLPELTWDLQNEIIVGTDSDGPVRGVEGAQHLTRGAQLFINMWDRAYSGNRRVSSVRAPAFVAPARLVGEACYTDTQCATNRCDGNSGRQGVCRCRVAGDPNTNLMLYPNDCKVGSHCAIRPRIASNFNLLAFLSRDVSSRSVTTVWPTLKNVCVAN